MGDKLTFREFLRMKFYSNEPVFFDGGMGTMIQKVGGIEYKIPEDLNFYHADVIKNIHTQYLEAGSNVLTANSFGANPVKLEGSSSHTAEEYIARAIQIEKDAVAEFEKNHPESKTLHYVSWDSGQIGKLMEPMGTLTFDQAYDSYKTAAVTAEKAGAELAIIETMSDLYEVKAAVLAIKENTSLPIVATMTFQSNLRTLTGADVLTCVTYLEALGVDALGFNCGGSLEEDLQLAEQFTRYAHIPVVAQPNAGLPVVINGKDVFTVEGDEFGEAQKKILGMGVCVLGGCCGTTPDHISAMIRKVSPSADPDYFYNRKSFINRHNSETYICSYNKTVQAGNEAGPVIIGERINPTGKKKCKEALMNNDMQFILSEAESQINAGAHILDVNVGLPGIDEKEMMVKAMKTIQGTFNVPLQLDSSEADVLEHGLRYYNGKALVNSVNGKQEVMDKVFPLVKKYGGSVVALCIDEDGIAPTTEGRFAVAMKIILEAAKYGIQPRDIFIDTLTLTVSSEQKTAMETVRAIRNLNAEFGGDGLKFVLGVSNISFGLPRRDVMNSRFFILALEAGLTAAIINPGSEAMMDSYRSYRSLYGFDENCIGYIEKYTGSVDPTTAKFKEKILVDAVSDGTISISINTTDGKTASLPQKKPSPKAEPSSGEGDGSKSQRSPEERNLIEIIEKGFKDKADEATGILLEKLKPVEVIDNCIVPALDSVGKDYEQGKKFLPQLLLSAETVGNSFAKIKETLEKSGGAQESKGTVGIATVFGDIHDIGKNIVKAMLENYGYEVIDMGKNVPVETVVKTVLEKRLRLVGLSALMTTTVANMEETIRQLKKAIAENNLDCKIVVGGAVLTEDYAMKIGADYYSKDAMQTVAVAKEVFEK